MALRKDSPYTPFMKDVMLKMIESGQLQRITDEYAKIANHKCENSIQETDEDNDVSLSYKKLFMLFLIIGVGMAMAIFVMIVEKISKRMKLTWSDQSIEPEIQNPGLVDSSTQTTNMVFHKHTKRGLKISPLASIQN